MNAARQVARELRAAGHDAFLAGGAVRDRLLDREPHDVDVATSARPEEVIALFPTGKLVGAAFGVVRVRREEDEVEVATFRSEGPYLDGRRPSSVRFRARSRSSTWTPTLPAVWVRAVLEKLEVGALTELTALAAVKASELTPSWRMRT